MTPSLIILRGNSGSGKSTVATLLRDKMGYKTALIEQDYLRRTLLKERDLPNQPNIRLIDQTVRFALKEGYNVVLEGILNAERYGAMLHALINEHAGPSHIYYFDIPLEETFRRHYTKPNAHEFGEKQLREWYIKGDILGAKNERIITHDLALEAIVEQIWQEIQ